jgi:gamma-glutamyltranspeptidase / glutathione hydrolase
MNWNFFLIFLTLPLLAFDEPETSSGFHPKQAVYARHSMVTSANPQATQAGFDILQKGGNAIDAAIAMQLVLNVVEPQSSGIGGGAFLLYYDKQSNQVIAFDGRETAPQGVNERWFLDARGKPLSHAEAIVGGRSVGVPGVLKMIEQAHAQFGILPWNTLFTSAIEIADKGFPLSPRLMALILDTPTLSPQSAPYFYENGKLKKEGDIVQNRELAATFQLLAEKGSDPFYHGEIAEDIVRAIQKANGVMTLEDLNRYQVKTHQPIVSSFRDYQIYGFPPPSGGGVAIAQILAILEILDLPNEKMEPAEFINTFSRASRAAFADRNYYLADPDFFPVPIDRLLDTNYLKKRAEEVIQNKTIKPGNFPGESLACCPPMIVSSQLELPSTSQICIVDTFGNCVSMTTSIENGFGSTVSIRGFFLNNQLTDFSFVPEIDNKKAANRVEPGKKPLSSMSPTIVFQNGKFVLAVGSAGGPYIIDYVAKVLCEVLMFNLNIQDAISFPNFASITDSIELEAKSPLLNLIPALEKLGNRVKISSLTSGTQGIQRLNEHLIGGVDPRREGKALGD